MKENIKCVFINVINLRLQYSVVFVVSVIGIIKRGVSVG